ncbi:unnamed protein product [marine sediment metagenome]|uniref:Uncharacterized protein n=1 Tax=marine sediment metagenome TaxID=412755 RepID=X1JKT7_9ZZZZ
MRKMYTAKCSQCGQRFRAYERADLLQRIRKHMWKEHRKWMLARMKAGRLAGGPGNPTVGMVLTAVAQGIPVALALIRLVKKPRWNRLGEAVNAFEPYMKPETRTAWQAIKAIKDIDIRQGGRK